MRREQQQPEKFQELQSNNHQKVPQIQSINQVMLRLQQLSQQIQNNPHQTSQHLKQYISVYVQNHNRSQEFFNMMCEHNMLAKLFTGGVSRPIYILQAFNLLLANTQKVHELVYIFSHPLFHNYLLINVQTMLQPISVSPSNSSSTPSSLTLANHQCIQYYIQLIKTLITKLLAESSQCTLLKLFCNSKYSYYPLLTNCIILAIRRNVREELVRVTAQHCILQLVGIMSKKQVGEYYFANIHMLVFFYEIIHQTIEEETQQSKSEDTTIKYLTDLLKAINLSYNHEAKERSFLLFFTIMSNLLTFKFMKTPAPGLHLLQKFSTSLYEIQSLKQMCQKYLTPIYFIFGKLLFNKYLNNITLSSIILSTQAISQLSQLKDINLLKLIKNHYEKNPLLSSQIEIQKQRNSYEEEQLKRQSLNIVGFRNSMIKIREQVFQKQYEHLIKQMERYNMDNEEFFSLKQNFQKKTLQTSNSNWLFGIGNIFKKINLFDIPSNQYIKRLSHLAAVKYTHEQPIKFLDQVLSPSGVYVYEFLKIKIKERYLFGQKSEDTQKIEISFNQNRDEFQCNNQFLKVVMNIADLAINEVESMWGQANRWEVFEKLQKHFNPKLQNLGEVYFTLHFRQYFQHSIFEYLCTSTNGKPRIELTPKIIEYFFNLSSTLLFDLSEMNLNKAKSQALKLQKELYSIINQNGFGDFCEYLQSDEQKHMVESAKKPSMNVSVIKFDKRQSTDESKKMTSSGRKKKSIFKSFTKSSISKDSPKKNPTHSQMKQSQTFKIIQTKMLHLQLLRFLLQQPKMGSNMKSLQQRLPLYKIFENNFTRKYNFLLQKSKDSQILYQAEGVGFNSQSDYECTFRVRVKFSDFTIVCELLHQQKLILKCNIKEFSLCQPYMRDQKQKSLSSKHNYLINLHPTSNTLEFKDMEKAIELLNTVNEIKFGFRQTKDSAILQYLNKENQLQK